MCTEGEEEEERWAQCMRDQQFWIPAGTVQLNDVFFQSVLLWHMNSSLHGVFDFENSLDSLCYFSSPLCNLSQRPSKTWWGHIGNAVCLVKSQVVTSCPGWQRVVKGRISELVCAIGFSKQRVLNYVHMEVWDRKRVLQEKALCPLLFFSPL